MQDDGAILRLGRLQAQASENGSVRDERPHAGMDDRVVAAELERGVRSARRSRLAYDHQPVLHLRR